MILYKAIKYTFLDYCIETLFNQILNNILIKENFIELKDLHPGMRFKEMTGGGTVFYDCIISYVKYLGKNTKHGIHVYYIDFRYKKSNSKILDDRLLRNQEGYAIMDLKTCSQDWNCKIY